MNQKFDFQAKNWHTRKDNHPTIANFALVGIAAVHLEDWLQKFTSLIDIKFIMTPKEQKTLENYHQRFYLWRKSVTNVIQKNAPLLNEEQAWEVGKIAIKSFQDLRDSFEFLESHEFIGMV